MLRIIALASLLLSTSLVLAGPVSGEWKSRYAALMAQIKARDVTAFEANFDESFFTISPKGKRESREAFFKMVDGLFADAKSVDAKINLTSARERAGAMMIGFVFDLTIHNKAGGWTKVHEVGTDTWRKIGGKWMTVRTVDKAEKITSSKK